MLALLVAIAGLSAPASAHDIGVARAELRERDGNRYELSVWTGPGAAHLFQSPELPDTCRYDGSPRGAQGSDRLRFSFICNEALTADDTLLLPWNREGTMLTAKWQDGSEAKFRITNNEVTVNGEVETRRGRKLQHGDLVGYMGEVYRVEVIRPAQ